MYLRVLGSGSCLVSQDRTTSSYLLNVADQTLMIDTGTGSMESLRKSGVSAADLDVVVNTHRHPDHVSDLVPLIQDKIVRSFNREESDLVLAGPEGHREYLRRRMHDEMRETPDTLEDSFGFNITVDNVVDLELNGVGIDVIEARHGPEDFEARCIKIFSDEREAVFTGDTDYFDQLVEFAESVDLIVADCSKPHDEKVKGHMTPVECANLARDAGADKLVLSHLYPEIDPSEAEETAREIFGGEVVVADDLQKVKV